MFVRKINNFYYNHRSVLLLYVFGGCAIRISNFCKFEFFIKKINCNIYKENLEAMVIITLY